MPLLLKNKFLKDNFITIFASVIIGVGNWVFGYLILKLVNENELTSYQAFFSLFGILTIPGMWITLMTTKLGKHFNVILVQYFQKNKAYFVGFLGLLLAISFAAVKETNLNVLLGILLFFLILIAFFASYFRGMLQHELQFKKLAYIGIFEVILKLALLLLCIGLDFRDPAAFFALTVQSVISVLILFKYTSQLTSFHPAEGIKEEAWLSFFYGFGIIFFTNIDAIMGKRLLEQNENAVYIAALQIIKLLFFASSALINVLLPNIIKSTDKKEALKMVLITSGLILTGSAITALGVGMEYELVAKYFKLGNLSLNTVLVFLLYSCLFSLSQIPLTIMLVKKIKALKFIIISIVIVQISLYSLFGNSLQNFIHIYGVTSALLLGISSIFTIKSIKYGKK